MISLSDSDSDSFSALINEGKKRQRSFTGHRATVSFSSDESSDDELKVPERSLRKSDDSRGLFSAIRTQTNSSSEDEEAYTQFLSKMKVSSRHAVSSDEEESDVLGDSLNGFIVPDDASLSDINSSDEDDAVFYVKTTNELNRAKEKHYSIPSTDTSDAESDLSDNFALPEATEDLSSLTDSSTALPVTNATTSGSISFSQQVSFSSHPATPSPTPSNRSGNSRKLSNSEASFSQQASLSEDSLNASRLSHFLSSDSDSDLLIPQSTKQTSLASLTDSDDSDLLLPTPSPPRSKRLMTSKRQEKENQNPKSSRLTPAKKLSLLKTKQTKLSESFEFPSLSDDTDDDVILIDTPIRPKAPPTGFTKATVPLTPLQRLHSYQGNSPAFRPSQRDSRLQQFARTEPRLYSTKPRSSFLASLATVCNGIRDPEANRYVGDFKKHKLELTERLRKLYNETIFDNKLSEVKVTWNTRLLKTAGFCKYMQTRNTKSKAAHVELSVKVCDSPERLRDTLIHELCHAAVWIIDEKQDSHGRYWQYWAKKSELVHGELPPIRRCHSYDINTKYIYQCTKCKAQIGRHSKSLDTNKKVCGVCKGKFELLVQKNGVQTPAAIRTPNKFAQFVKENYGSVKGTPGLKSHGDVMKALSKEFKNVQL